LNIRKNDAAILQKAKLNLLRENHERSKNSIFFLEYVVCSGREMRNTALEKKEKREEKMARKQDKCEGEEEKSKKTVQ
jgi:hypothetical protein